MAVSIASGTTVSEGERYSRGFVTDDAEDERRERTREKEGRGKVERNQKKRRRREREEVFLPDVMVTKT